jgi:putative tryptophan/tyrosine transport system permease protein
MSMAALLGATETGLLMSIVALAVFLSFRVLNFPDLTVDGSFTLGGAVCASLIAARWNPFAATAFALFAGAAAGFTTGVINVKFKIVHLVASMLVMIGLYSVNIRIMGGPNLSLLGAQTIFDSFRFIHLRDVYLVPLVFFSIVVVIKLLLDGFLQTDLGLALRATGENERMALANGVATGRTIILGIALSNAMTGFAGALFAQDQGSADVSMGVGTLITGLAAVIGGSALLPSRRIAYATLACIIGSIIYQLAVAAALRGSLLGLRASDVSILTAILVCLALVLPKSNRRRLGRRASIPASSAATNAPRAREWAQ